MSHSHQHGDSEHEHDHDDEHVHDALQECIEACLNCHVACTMTVQHCLASGGEHAEVNLVGVLLDCADMCQTNANFMLRGSPYHVVSCAACAEICRACEEACRAATRDDQLVHCAEVCAACAESCERMANADAQGDDEDE